MRRQETRKEVSDLGRERAHLFYYRKSIDVQTHASGPRIADRNAQRESDDARSNCTQRRLSIDRVEDDERPQS